jgi:hypothetical protein
MKNYNHVFNMLKSNQRFSEIVLNRCSKEKHSVKFTKLPNKLLLKLNRIPDKKAFLKNEKNYKKKQVK